MQRKRSGLGLFGFYAAVTLVPIVVLGLLLTRSLRSDLEHGGVAAAGTIADSIARSAIGPTLSGDTLADGPTAAERVALRNAMMPLLTNGDALQLRLRDRVGHIVFDPLVPNQRPTGPTDGEVVEALSGHPVRLLTRINADEADRAKALGARAIEVYTPVFAGSGNGNALGALEIYVPYAPIAASTESSYRHMTILLTIGLLVLWSLLATISWSVTQRLRRSAASNRRLARVDALTGLANRTALAEALSHSLASAHDRSVSVVVMDIDGFTQINEVLGHENGDRFLRHIAEQLTAVVEPTDLVARVGGDEFSVLMNGTDRRGADLRLEKIRWALLNEVELGGVALAAEIAVGRVDGRSGDDPAELLRQAGVACRAAKHAKVPLLSYDSALEGFDADRLSLVAELRHSIDSEHLVLHYQPKIATSDGHVVGVEALLRWQHPTRGLLLPGAFLPAVESTELILPLTDWVVDAGCRQAISWLEAGRPLAIAVNISARCLRDPMFPDRVLGALARHRLPVNLLSIEITETAVISDPDRAASTLRRLSERGIKISVDDFGVGYTSLGHLHQLPIHELKIDQQFVTPLISAPDGRAVVRALVSLGHELGMTVVAEGVEDDATLAAIAAIGCDIAQGYGIARPAPAEVLDQWLIERRSAVPIPTPVNSLA